MEGAGLTRPWNDAAGDFLRAVDGPASVVLGARADGELVGSAMVGSAGTAAGSTTSPYLMVPADKASGGS